MWTSLSSLSFHCWDLLTLEGLTNISMLQCSSAHYFELFQSVTFMCPHLSSLFCLVGKQKSWITKRSADVKNELPIQHLRLHNLMFVQTQNFMNYDCSLPSAVDPFHKQTNWWERSEMRQTRQLWNKPIQIWRLRLLRCSRWEWLRVLRSDRHTDRWNTEHHFNTSTVFVERKDKCCPLRRNWPENISVQVGHDQYVKLGWILNHLKVQSIGTRQN